MRSYLDKRIRPHLQPTLDSWRVDETYVLVKSEWKYLYRAVDSEGNTRLLHAECARGMCLGGRTVFPQSPEGNLHPSTARHHRG